MDLNSDDIFRKICNGAISQLLIDKRRDYDSLRLHLLQRYKPMQAIALIQDWDGQVLQASCKAQMDMDPVQFLCTFKLVPGIERHDSRTLYTLVD